MTRNIFFTAMLVALFSTAAFAQYVITGNSTDGFTATKDGETVGEANRQIGTVIWAIRNDANGADVSIQFGDGDVLDIGTESASFANPTTGITWGEITLSGKITSANSYCDSYYLLGTLAISNNISVKSIADIANTNTQNNCAVYNTGGMVTIAGGTVSATGDGGWAVSGSATTGTVIITGGTVSATGDGGRAVYSYSKLILGGSPTIGMIQTMGQSEVSVITEGENAFAPDTKTYTLVGTDNYTAGYVIVAGGAAYAANFTLTNEYQYLATSGDNLFLAIVGHYAYAKTGTAYTITKKDGIYANIQYVINAIGYDAGGNDVSIQFGDGENVLDIGTDSASFGNAAILGSGNTWGKITLSGKITSALDNSSYYYNGTVIISDNISVESIADIANTQNNRAIYNTGGSVTIAGGAVSTTGGTAVYNLSGGTVTIAGGTVSATGDGGYGAVNNYSDNDGSGTVTIAGGTVSATGDGGVAVSNYGGTVTITGGTVSATGDRNYGRAVNNYGGGTVTIAGGTVSATGRAVAVNNTGGTVTITGGEVSATDGYTIYNESAGGTVTITGGEVSTTGDKYSAVYNPGGTVTITGGTVSATTGVAVSGGTVTITDGTVSATTGVAVSGSTVTITGGTVSAVSGGTITITGGTVSATGDNGWAVVGMLILGGSPTINGNISKVEVITEGEYAFVPGTKTYTLRTPDSYTAGYVILVGGAHYAAHFTLTNEGQYLATSGDDLFVAFVGYYAYAKTGTAYTITKKDGIYADIQSVLDAIRNDAGGNDVSIQFGDGENVLEIGTGSASFENPATGTTWGKITLSGKITSANSGYFPSTVVISDNISVESIAEIANTQDNSAVYNTGTVTIAGGTVSAITGTVYNNGSGTITIAGGMVSATTGTAVYSNDLRLGGSPIIGGIRGANNLNVITEGENVFAPGTETYTLTLDYSPYSGRKIVQGGAAYIANFTFEYEDLSLWEGWYFAANDGHIVAAKYNYTVTFLDWDGTVLKTETVEHGSAVVTALEDPTRAGYTFTGWDKWDNYVTSDLTITALYAINTYIVTFLDRYGAVLETQSVEYGSAATAPTVPEIEGYKFTGWDKAFDNVMSDLIVYAEYEEITPILSPQIATGNLRLTQTQNGINLAAKTNATIAVYNLSGKLINRQSYNAGNHSISFGHLPKGMYVVKALHGSEKQVLRVTVR
jgi:hypothetical protein